MYMRVFCPILHIIKKKQKGQNEMTQNKSGVEIEGMILSNEENGAVAHEEFLQAFTQFVESKGWIFAGTTKQSKAENNE
jgi:hypothetical protein